MIIKKKVFQALEAELKKEKEKNKDYTNWEKDFGFLNLILTRKKNITKEFLIGTYDKQKSETDYLTDEELEPTIETIVKETMDQLSTSYKDFLIEKYFGSEESFISYISEEVYVDLTSDAINRNVKKIRSTLQKRQIDSLSSLNRSMKIEER